MEDTLNKEVKINSNPVVRWLFIVSGLILTGIGIVGMFVPLLPTTVFLLLAAWCFARSSPSIHRWLHTNKLFGKYFSDYKSGKGMTLKSKIFSLGILWIGIGYAGIFVTEELYVRILLLAIATGVTIHILRLKPQA